MQNIPIISERTVAPKFQNLAKLTVFDHFRRFFRHALAKVYTDRPKICRERAHEDLALMAYGRLVQEPPKCVQI